LVGLGLLRGMVCEYPSGRALFLGACWCGRTDIQGRLGFMV